MDKKFYILVNKDVNIGKGKFCGQISHAVGTFCYRGKYKDEDMSLFLKNNEIEYIYLSEKELEKIESTRECVVIRDMGLTQLEPNTLTCIALGIMTKGEKDILLEKLLSDNDKATDYLNFEDKLRLDNLEYLSRELAMYILVNEEVKLNKEDLAGFVAGSVSNLYFNKIELQELVDEYMIRQKKIILKCPKDKLYEYADRGIAVYKNSYDENESSDMICINLGIKDKSKVDEFIKSLKLYRK